jgi:gamma-glutamyltranspeptidase / glutathione hydrolase
VRSKTAFAKLTPANYSEMGHDARKVEGFAQSVVGRGQIIQRVPNPGGGLVWAAGSDPRGDGHAVVQI